jgi:hypothetical protein
VPGGHISIRVHSDDARLRDAVVEAEMFAIPEAMRHFTVRD